MTNIANWKIPTISGGFYVGKSSVNGPFSIAMLNKQRVMLNTRIKNAVPHMSVNLQRSPEFLGGFILRKGWDPIDWGFSYMS